MSALDPAGPPVAMHPGWSSRRAWILAWLGVGAVFLVANRDLLWGEVGPLRDGARFFRPYAGLIADCARSGRLLVWNPWSAGGVPEFAEPQLGTLSPLYVALCWLGGGTHAFLVQWLFVWWLGGAGVLCLARHLGAPAWGGAVAALGFLFSGQYVCGAPWISHLLSASFLPFIVWRLDRALLERRALPALEAGALWGLSSLGGYPGLTIATGAFLGFWALGRWWSRQREGAGAGASASLWMLVLVLVSGGVVLAPTYVGFLVELCGYAIRSGSLGRDAAVGDNPLAPAALVTLVSPWAALLKDAAPASLWQETWIESVSLYVGALVSVLALAALGRPDRWRWSLAGAVLLALACAVGHHLPVRGWLYDVLPPFRTFRHASILRLYAMFALIVLALYATRDLARERAPRRALQIASALCALAAVAGTFFVRSLAESLGAAGLDLARWPATLHLVAAWGGALVVAWALSGSSAARAWAVPAALALAAGDALLTSGWLRPLTVTAAHEEFWRRVAADHEPSIELTARGLDRLLRLDYQAEGIPSCNENLAPKTATLAAYNSSWGPQFALFESDPLLAPLAVGSRRLWFAERGERLTPTLATLFAVARHIDASGTVPLLLHERSAMMHPADTALHADIASVLAELPPARALGATKVTSYLPDELVFEVDCPGTGWLIVTDRWAPGWKARVNGEVCEPLGANFLFRGVPVRAGHNTIDFHYAPAWLPWLLAASWGTLGAVALAALVTCLRGRRPSARSHP